MQKKMLWVIYNYSIPSKVYHLTVKSFASIMYLLLPQVFDKHIWGINTKKACLHPENVTISANILIPEFI